MKKIKVIFASILMVMLVSTTASAQINFENGSFADAKAKAASSGKLIFVDAYAVWCGPCKWMEANVFPNKEVSAYFNEHFVCYKYDMEKGDGPAFAKKYEIRNYPTYLFLDKDGNVVHKAIGSRPADQFIDEAKKAVDKENK